MARRKTLTLATYNVNGIGTRLPHLLAWLEAEKPDAVALQELKATDAAFPVAELEQAGYGALWQGEARWNGVALLGRGVTPIESRRRLPGEPADTQSRYLEAAIHDIVVAGLYLPNGNPQPGPKFDYKLRWMERLIKHARSLVALPHPVVIMGDFNVIPTDADVYDPKAWRKDALLQPAVRDAYARLLVQGWTDALRTRHPEETIYTFWDYFRQHWQTNSGLRIDHLLLNAELAPRLVDAGVDKWVRGEARASDHAPAWIELDLGEGAAKKAAAKKTPAKKAPAKTTPAKTTKAPAAKRRAPRA